MSGFRKFRTALHRRRRSIEAAELGLITSHAPDHAQEHAQDHAKDHAQEHSQDHAKEGAGTSERGGRPRAGARPAFEETAPLEFSPSLEAREIGPTPIAWSRRKRPETDN